MLAIPSVREVGSRITVLPMDAGAIPPNRRWPRPHPSHGALRDVEPIRVVQTATSLASSPRSWIRGVLHQFAK